MVAWTMPQWLEQTTTSRYVVNKSLGVIPVCLPWPAVQVQIGIQSAVERSGGSADGSNRPPSDPVRAVLGWTHNPDTDG